MSLHYIRRRVKFLVSISEIGVYSVKKRTERHIGQLCIFFGMISKRKNSRFMILTISIVQNQLRVHQEPFEVYSFPLSLVAVAWPPFCLQDVRGLCQM